MWRARLRQVCGSRLALQGSRAPAFRARGGLTPAYTGPRRPHAAITNPAARRGGRLRLGLCCRGLRAPEQPPDTAYVP